MKLLTRLAFPSNKSLVLLGILVTLLFLYNDSKVFAEEQAVTSSEAAAEDYQDNWWRSVRKNLWEWEGADWTVVKNVLARIENATGKRRYQDKFDTVIDYGPGHWVYEWSIIGDDAYKEGLRQEKNGNEQEARKAFLQSSIYYTIASYPHLRDKHSRAALANAFEGYRRAGRLSPIPLEEWRMNVDGVDFSAFVHFPTLNSTEPIPVILKTGGMDVLSTEFYPLSKTINNAGAAMIVFDSPGTGNLGIIDPNYDKHHVAVLKRVLNDRRFDPKRIGVWSESMAGLIAVKLALGEHRHHVAASVNSCGCLHAVHALELTGGVPKQYDVHKMIELYKNRQLSQKEIDEFNQATLNPNLQGLILDFQGETYIDRVRASSDNVLGLLAKSLPISLKEQGLLGKKNVTNTPLLTINTHRDPLVPAAESRMAADASIQGKLMIYDEYEGHCVSRAEMPMIIQWLSYHLKLNSLEN